MVCDKPLGALVGSLSWACALTRPDMKDIVGAITRQAQGSPEICWRFVYKILSCLNETN